MIVVIISPVEKTEKHLFFLCGCVLALSSRGCN